jgi:hypothetical protein
MVGNPQAISGFWHAFQNHAGALAAASSDDDAVYDLLLDRLQHEDSEDLGIRMYVPGIASEFTEDAHDALLRALDHALGERQFAESVQYTEVHPLPADAGVDDYLPLTQLEDYIRWRKHKREDRNGQQGAAPNGGPVTQRGDSDVTQGPPWVS